MSSHDSKSVTIYVAQRCHLCDAAMEVVETVRAESRFDLNVVDITGVDELEARYRELIPVVEIDGVQSFTYHVTADGLRAALL
jgi:glutaredoxin